MPGRSWSRNDFLYAYIPDSLAEELAVDRFSIMDQESWYCFFRERLGDLLSSPFGCRIRRDVEVRYEASILSKHNKTEQNTKCCRRDREEVNFCEWHSKSETRGVRKP